MRVCACLRAHASVCTLSNGPTYLHVCACAGALIPRCTYTWVWMRRPEISLGGVVGLSGVVYLVS